MMPSWLGKTFPIAAIFSFRMLGLFMLIPVFTVYANQLSNATPALIGLALGAYGLTQGLLQLPFGILSDRYGRKPLITLGLILFALGSLMGALTHSIHGMIFARILQGSGAIGSVLIALVADLTSNQDRTKAMAVIGITIAVSFSLALILSPFITHAAGLAGIFYLTTGLALFGLLILHTSIPNPITHQGNDTINSRQLKQVFMDRDLQRLDAGIFCLHFMLISTFYALPLILQSYIQQGQLKAAWQFYLPIMLLAFLIMMPILMLVDRRRKTKELFVGAIALIVLAQLSLSWLSSSFYSLCGLFFVYFVAFNLLEANLPALISKQANPKAKGCAMGVYSSCQFLGIFVGGSLAGLVYQQTGAAGIFLMNSAVAGIWFILTLSLKVKPS